jgi:putative SOS response-associated peptidase YedK
MCFTVNVNLVKEEIEERYGVDFPGKYRYEPSYYYHAFGLPEIPAVCSGTPQSVSMLKWGLIPEWIRTVEDAEEIRFKTFNARSESISTKPSFSSSLNSKRCLLPVKGFYEWQHVGKEKIPWYIYLSDNQIITLAGLYSDWTNALTGEIISTFSIITTEANEIMAEVHNSGKRMPAILNRDDEKKWIDISLSSSEALNLLKPYQSGLMKAHTISPLINNRSANRNTPELILPYNYKASDLLF